VASKLQARFEFLEFEHETTGISCCAGHLRNLVATGKSAGGEKMHDEAAPEGGDPSEGAAAT